MLKTEAGEIPRYHRHNTCQPFRSQMFRKNMFEMGMTCLATNSEQTVGCYNTDSCDNRFILFVDSMQWNMWPSSLPCGAQLQGVNWCRPWSRWRINPLLLTSVWKRMFNKSYLKVGSDGIDIFTNQEYPFATFSFLLKLAGIGSHLNSAIMCVGVFEFLKDPSPCCFRCVSKWYGPPRVVLIIFLKLDSWYVG